MDTASHSQLMAQKAMLDELREILRDYASDKEHLLHIIETYQTHINELEMQNKLLNDRLAGSIYDL